MTFRNHCIEFLQTIFDWKNVTTIILMFCPILGIVSVLLPEIHPAIQWCIAYVFYVIPGIVMQKYLEHWQIDRLIEQFGDEVLTEEKQMGAASLNWVQDEKWDKGTKADVYVDDWHLMVMLNGKGPEYSALASQNNNADGKPYLMLMAHNIDSLDNAKHVAERLMRDNGSTLDFPSASITMDLQS